MSTLNIGINLKEATYIETNRPFINLAKSLNTLIPEAWDKNIPNRWNTKEEVLYLDRWGYPTKLPSSSEVLYTSLGTSLFIDSRGNYPSGTYILSFKGKASLKFERYSGSNKTSVVSKTYDVNANTTTYVLNHIANNNGIYISITDIESPMSDLSLVLEDNLDIVSKTFDPEFIESLKPYKNIRYLEWTKTNGSKEVVWADRTMLNDISWGGAYPGETPVPWDLIINLSNVTNTNPWINIPHAADDNYISKLAAKFARNLKSTLALTVEYTNEPWGMPVQRQYLLDYANKNFDYSKEPTIRDNFKVADAYSKRAVEVISIFQSEFLKAGKDVNRVIGSISGQSSWVPWTDRVFDFKFADREVNPNAASAYIPLTDPSLESSTRKELTGIDQLAIAAYFGYELGLRDNLNNWKGAEGVNNVFKAITEGGVIGSKSSLSIAKDKLTNYNAYSDQIDLPLVAYEGGQHLSTLGYLDREAIDTFIKVNRDPRMKEVYQTHLNNWATIVGQEQLFMHWALTSNPSNKGYGSWGLEEYVGQAKLEGLEATPKLDAVLSYFDNF